MKKTVYLFLTIILGLLLSFILHALTEVWYINYLLSVGVTVKGTYFLGVGWCALPVWSQHTFSLLGIVGGYLLGKYWWRVVYIEKRHWFFRR